MTKIKIFADEDDVKIVVFPWHKKLPLQTDDEFMDAMTVSHPIHGSKFSSIDLQDFDESQLPDRSVRDKWYPNFSSKSEKIKIDHNYEHKLMRISLIRNKHIEKITSFEEYKKALKMTDKDWYEQALKNLDDKVAKGEADKPTIRAKLTAKIQQLNQEES